MAATVVSFGEWLPDLSTITFPNLVDAKNVEPINGVYTDYNPLSSLSQVVPGSDLKGLDVTVVNSADYFYATSNNIIYMSNAGATFNSRSATLTGITACYFQRFDDLMIMAQGVGLSLLSHTAGSATNFATLTASPTASYVGRINQFVIIGNTSDAVNGAVPHRIQWSGIDAPSSWPTPNSATAIAQQSGEQFLDPNYGEVRGFSSGDQFALVFQQNAVTRMTYVGPPVVFQFDKISDGVGCRYPNSIVQVKGFTYFLSNIGIFVTDGVAVTNLGINKVEEFLRNVNRGSYTRVYGAHNQYRNLIYWTYNSTGVDQTITTHVLIFNYAENRFTYAEQNSRGLYSTTGNEIILAGSNVGLYGFDSANTFCAMSATAGSAIIVTADAELNAGGRSYVDGVKPNVESSGTAPAITVRVGSRNDLGTTPSYTATTTPTTRTGFADFRVDAKYHRAEVQIVGNFTKATGLEFKAFLTGET